MNIAHWLQKERWNVGVDLSGSSVKIVALKKQDGQYQLMAHAHYHRTNTAALTAAFQSHAIRASRIRVNIEDPSMKIRKIVLPAAPEAELPELIKWSVKDIVAGSVDDFIFRSHPLPHEDGTASRAYLVYVLGKHSLAQHLADLKALGLAHIDVVEPSVAALFLTLAHSTALQVHERVVLIDIGAHCTHFIVVWRGGVLFSRPLGAMTGVALTQQIGRNCGVAEEEAARFQTDSPPADMDASTKTKLLSTIAHYLSNAAIDIQRSIDAYSMQCPQQPVTRICCTGGGSLLAGLVRHIETTLNIPTDALDPFHNIHMGRFAADALITKRAYYGLALGLALE